MPYIIGVHSSLMAEARRNELDDAIVLNVDDGTMEDIHNDRSLLPSEAVSQVNWEAWVLISLELKLPKIVYFWVNGWVELCKVQEVVLMHLKHLLFLNLKQPKKYDKKLKFEIYLFVISSEDVR